MRQSGSQAVRRLPLEGAICQAPVVYRGEKPYVFLKRIYFCCVQIPVQQSVKSSDNMPVVEVTLTSGIHWKLKVLSYLN